MGFYHTSGNVRMFRNIIIDYGSTSEVSPYEYMKTYIEKCPEATVDSKLSWIAETFLGYQKHEQFLKDIASHLSEELSEDDQGNFMIILHAVTFQIPIKSMQLLYKCLFNLSKQLLDTFTKFLSNNEVLPFISEVAQAYYDTDYITEKIIGPLFEWQPYISEMAHNYAEYMQKVESRKIKPLTVPIQPNVLNRKRNEPVVLPAQPSFPVTPPNSLRTKTKMLTKSVIDRRLKNIHDKNKQNATNLLNSVKTLDVHYAQTKSKRISYVDDKNEIYVPKPCPKQKFVMKPPTAPVKENAVTMKRMNKRIQLSEQEEVKWLENIMYDCRNKAKIEELEEYDRQEKERERLQDIEKKHLMGQISHEEAVIAKKKLQDENKKKYEDFLKEKQVWNDEIENWKKAEIEKSRKQVEKLSMFELAAVEAKNANLLKKKENAYKVKKESDEIIAKAMTLKREELDRRISMIREINIMTMIAKKARVPRIIDLTETAGFGFLSEMSIAELQERLSAVKIGINEELERKKALIREENDAAKRQLEDVRNSIKKYIDERSTIRKIKKTFSNLEAPPTKEINDLKKILEEKKRLRIKLTT